MPPEKAQGGAEKRYRTNIDGLNLSQTPKLPDVGPGCLSCKTFLSRQGGTLLIPKARAHGEKCRNRGLFKPALLQGTRDS